MSDAKHEVFSAITALIASGEKVTDQSIRDRMGGRGSFSTISKYKNQFFAQMRENSRALFGPEIPETLIPILHSFWNEAIQHAGDHNIAELNRLRNRTESAEADARRAALDADQIGRELKDSIQENMRVQDRCERLVAEVADAKAEAGNARQAIEKQATDHQAELQRRELEVQQAMNTLKLEAQQRSLEQEARLSALAAQLESTNDKLKYERERSEAESDRLMQLVYDAREEARKAEGKIRELQDYIAQAKKKADAEIHIATEKASIMAIKADRLLAEIERRNREDSGG